MANLAEYRCGHTDLRIQHSSPFIGVRASYGSITICCQTCHRLVSMYYGDPGWNETRVFNMVLRMFQGSQKRIIRSKWPKHLTEFDPGDRNV